MANTFLYLDMEKRSGKPEKRAPTLQSTPSSEMCERHFSKFFCCTPKTRCQLPPYQFLSKTNKPLRQEIKISFFFLGNVHFSAEV